MYEFKHVFKPEYYSDQPTSTVIITTDAVTMEDLVETFAAFLKGCGFSSKMVDERLLGEEE